MASLIRAGLTVSLLVTGLGCRSKNSPDAVREPVASSIQGVKTAQVFATVRGKSSWVYVQHPGETVPHRLTDRKASWETNPTLSADRNMIAYATAGDAEGKSEVWIARLDGSAAHRVSAADEDALLPAFGLDGRTLFYVKSTFNGHYSPIARPRRHEFVVMMVPIGTGLTSSGMTPVQLTQQKFFDLRSLAVSPNGERFLISTSGYPIGSLIEEYEVAHPLEIKRIFQPHVPSEPSSGASFGEAAYLHDGMDIVFTAATNAQGGNFDYNVYLMSDVTGGNISALTRRSGMIDSMSAGPDGMVTLFADGRRFMLNPDTGTLEGR